MYPLKFEPILKQTLWGGDKIIPFKHLNDTLANVGESWEVSAVEGSESIVANGADKGLTLPDMVRKYKEDLVGEANYARFGNKFPLLIKFIDAKQALSIQIHPDDEYALENENEYGKNEMWYVLDAEPGAYLYCGLSRASSKEEIEERIKNNTITEILNKIEVKEAQIGSIVAVSGIADVQIGDTLCSPENPDPIPFQKISEPTIAMTFMVNDSPLAGKEGKFVTSRHLRERLFRELNTDVSLRVEETDTTEAFKVSGRGELHLSVLIENMRREGYEFAVSKAEVIYKEDELGHKLEPFEIAYIDVPDEFAGTIINMLNQRKGELQGMAPTGNGTTRLEFSVPSRGLIGFRGDFMTATKGTGIINTTFDEYLPYKGDMSYRSKGSLIAFESGTSITYGLFNAQERGTLFIGPGEQVYAGMVVGENPRAEDMEVNVCKKKQLTNTRSSGSDDALKLSPPKVMSLEQALDFIDTDELLEITPKSFRIRKKILDHTLRYRANRK